MLVKLALTLPRFIEVPVPIQESEHSCICVLEVTLYLFLVSIKSHRKKEIRNTEVSNISGMLDISSPITL
jgi:hypothetical protein